MSTLFSARAVRVGGLEPVFTSYLLVASLNFLVDSLEPDLLSYCPCCTCLTLHLFSAEEQNSSVEFKYSSVVSFLNFFNSTFVLDSAVELTYASVVSFDLFGCLFLPSPAATVKMIRFIK